MAHTISTDTHSATVVDGQLVRKRRRLYLALEPSARATGLSRLNRVIAIAIVVSVVFAIIESEPRVLEASPALFVAVEYFFGGLFLMEYLARLWVSVENPRYAAGWRGRVRYMVSPTALLDLLAVSPLFLAAIGTEAYVVRLVRLLRVVRLANLGRFSGAIGALTAAIRSRRFELLVSFCFAGLVLLLTSTLMYVVEGGGQPDAFGSIPRAMWWSVATLTTVGYGDVIPLTPMGRVLAGITAVTGIGLIAMPTGILAAALSQAMRSGRTKGLDHTD
jgi:voltage-gated potassium channel